jgi:acyl-coenzyme A synthetase/AMP-(fatty) acid ligase
LSALPLISHRSSDSIAAWRDDKAVTADRFLGDVRQLASAFPEGEHVLNLCGDRYRFGVGLAAAILTGKISLLPSSHSTEVLRQIGHFTPDVFCLTDSCSPKVEMREIAYPPMDDLHKEQFFTPLIDEKQRVAVVFTSGTTGKPQPHPKSWGCLVGSVKAEAERLQLRDDLNYAIVGTVPPQHMYGLESTMLMAWHSGNAFTNAHPLYPADVCAALAKVPMPRILVTSPVHLRSLLNAGVDLPEVACVLSATAPLSQQLALEVERGFNAPLWEIYGSTETGQIASRRATRTDQWHLFPGIELCIEERSAYARGANIETDFELNDVLEALDKETFLLHGRKADLINVAGKRHSLANLNHQLTSIPGVQDGAFFMPDSNGSERVVRLAACVVAPGIEPADLLASLRERIDPVFLPRPLLFVHALPRNAAGKLPRTALQAMFLEAGNFKSQ